MNTRSLQLLTLGAALYGVARVLLVWDDLPSTVASHFDSQGRPDVFSSKEEFFIVYGLAMGLVFSSLLVAIPLLKVIPPKYINIPHKEYWLAGRLDEARAKMAKALWWMCLATALLSTGVLEFVLRSNLKGTPFPSNSMLVLMVVYLGFTVVWLFQLMTSFKPPS
jgi:hypothetical protein